MPDSLQPVTSATAARYKYYTVDIMSNTIIGEIPLEDVSYENTLKQAGTFDGKITVSDQTTNLDLYKTTLPGKTALYVVRDDVCVWGGIIWGRSYDLVTRSLTVSASEFTSYFSHRLVWKTYASNFTGQVIKNSGISRYAYVGISNRLMKSAPRLKDANGVRNTVYLSFSDRSVSKFSGKSYDIIGVDDGAPTDPTAAGFYINLIDLPRPKSGTYENVNVSLRADTYEYVRDLIESSFEDFIDIDFPNETAAPGISKAIEITGYSITSTGTYTGVATLYTSKAHKLAPGQNVELNNVHEILFGEFIVKDVPTATTFTVYIDNPKDADDPTETLLVESKSYTSVTPVKDLIQYRQIVTSVTRYISHIQRTAGIVTLTTTTKHKFKKNDVIAVSIDAKAPALKSVGGKQVNTFNWEDLGSNTVYITSATAYTLTFTDPHLKYHDAGYNVPKTKVSTAKKNTVRFATPRVQLKLYPIDSHGYIPGDRLKISGVDSIGWQSPIYDGYNKVVEADPGTPRTFTHYSANAADNTFVLYFADDPEFEISEFITISSSVALLKGTHQIEKITDPAEGTSDPYQVSFIKMVSDDVAKTSVSSSTASITGSGWITFDPAYDQLSTVDLREPDATAAIKEMRFDTESSTKDRAGSVYVDTVDRHGFNLGDTVNIVYTDPETNRIFGARDVVVKGTKGNDSDTIVYKIKDSDVPYKSTAKSAKKGTITRTKTKLGGLPTVESTFRQMVTDGNLITIMAEDHNFSVGDDVIVIFADSAYGAYDSGESTVKVVETTQDTFSYYAQGGASSNGEFIVKQISFPADKVESVDAIKLKVVTDKQVETTTSTVTGEVTEVTRNIPISYIRTVVNSVGDDYVDFTTSDTSGTAAELKAGDKITISGFPTTVGTVEPAVTVRPARNLNPYRIEYDYDSKKKCGYVYFYTDQDPEMYDPEYVTLSGFIMQKARKKGGALTNYSMWKFVTTDSKKASTATKKVKTMAVTDTKTKKVMGYGIKYDKNNNPLNFFIKIKVSALWTSDWHWQAGESGHGTDRGRVDAEQGKPITTENVVTKTDIKLSQFNMASAYVVSVTNNGETFRVKTNTKFSIPVAKNVSEFSPYATTTRMKAASTLFYIDGASTEKPDIKVGDSLKLSGFKNVGSNLYAGLNGKSYPVIKVDDFDGSSSETGVRRWVHVYIRNPFTKSSKPVRYAVKSYEKNEEYVKGIALHNVGGVAILDYTSVSTETREIDGISRSTSANATITSYGHGLQNGDWINLWAYGKSYLSLNANNSPVQISEVTENTFKYSIPNADACEIARYSVAKSAGTSTVVLTLAGGEKHRFLPGDVVTLSSFSSTLAGYGFTGDVTLTAATPKNLTFKSTTLTAPATVTKSISNTGTVTLKTALSVSVTDDSSPLGVIVPAPSIVKAPIAFVRTYGEYSQSANLGGMEWSTPNFSTLTSRNTPLLGSELVNLGQHLEQYSNNLNGFDYRIDCELYTDSATGNKKFKRIFRFIPIYPITLTSYINSLPLQDNPFDPNSNVKIRALAPGQVAPPSAFGADKIVFEYPGNISNINFSENAENAATRIFVSSATGQAGAGGAAYSGAVAEDLLADGWPILDKAEKADWPLIGNDQVNIDQWGNYDTESDLFRTAKRYIYESKPPAGNFVITVNGSLNPLIGTYSPGQWCSLIINDPFVQTRLNSPLEPRKDVILRKVDAIKVTVPNNPAFPEQIDLSLVTDWQVDRIGE